MQYLPNSMITQGLATGYTGQNAYRPTEAPELKEIATRWLNATNLVDYKRV